MKTAALFLFLSSLGAGTAVAGACLPGPPPSRGDGSIAGVTVPGGTQYYFKDALLAGFDCFEELSSWFPSYITTTNALSPTRVVVDMAYAAEATATFFNVVVPARGNYTLTFRYAFASGLFPGVTNRPEGIKVNDVVITSSLSFPITGSFTTYQNSSLLVPLNAGKNTIQMFNIASASVSRLDAMTVTAADAGSCIAVPGAPGALSAQAAGSTSQVSLTWTGSAAPAGCTAVSYSVFRSTTP